MLILCYTIQQVKPNVCTNTQNPRSYSSREIFETNFPVLHLSDRWKKEKKKWENKAKQNAYTIEFNSLYVYIKIDDSNSQRT